MGDQKQVLLRHTEEFKFEKVDKGEGKIEVIISGNAMPLNKMSRNKVFYRPDSVKKAVKSLEGVAFLFNHDSSQSLGHVQKSGLTDSHVTYKANIDPAEEKYLNKVERGDIRHVSVGCMVDAVEFMEDGSIECDVTEFVELSAVTVPGFQDTSAEKEDLNNAMLLTEKFGSEDQIEKLKEKAKTNHDIEQEAHDKKQALLKSKEAEDDDDKDKDKEGDDEDDEEEKKENPKDDPDYDGDEDEDNDDDDDSEETGDGDDDKDKDAEGDNEDDDEDKDKDEKLDEDAGVEDDASPEEKLQKLTARVGELFSKYDEVVNRLSIMEANMDALNDSEEDVESNDQDKSKENLSPDEKEEFVDNKDKITRGKNEFDAKEKALTGENTKKINEEKEVVDMNKVRLKNTI